MNKSRSLLLTGATGIAACVLAGCSGSSNMSLTGNTPSQYSHVWVTTQQVWLNTSSTATADDSGWYKYTLSSPTTIDLVGQGGGNLASITDSLRAVPGTYSQVRLIPVDPSAALSTSAQNAGALYNSEADYVDSAGVTHQLPLEFLNPDKGLGIQTALKVPIGNISGALENGTGTATGTTSTTDTGTTIGSTTGTTTGSTTGIGIGTGTTSNTTSSATQTANQFAIFEDGTTDLVPFTTGSTSGIMLSQHASAYDLSKAGGISGSLTLTNITTSTSGLPNIEASAQVLSADGTRHVVVATTTVGADGSFLLYPLAASTNGTYYDVVIHGPGIATILIKSVIVSLPSSSSTIGSTTPATSSDTTNPNNTTAADGTTTSTGTTNTSANNTVAIGTLTPRSATPYTAQIKAPTALPAGALVGFYQTLDVSGAVPYVIETSPIDPVNQVLFAPQSLSSGTIDSGTWASTGAAVTLISAAPVEGAGVYDVSPYATGFGDAPLTTRVTAPAAAATTSTPPQTVSVPALPLASGSASGTLRATVTTTPGKYTDGVVLVSSNGTLVGLASLGSGFSSGSATVSVSGLPANVPSAAYYVTVRAWNASGAVSARQWSDQLIDMRSSTSGTIDIALD